MKIETKFDFLEFIKIKAIDTEGRIVKISIARSVLYHVEYWRNSEIKTIWCYEDEIEKKRKSK